jgi:hypothetical protein
MEKNYDGFPRRIFFPIECLFAVDDYAIPLKFHDVPSIIPLFRAEHTAGYNEIMFKHLTNFSYPRNKKEAFGFYLAYLVLFVLIGVVVAAIIGVATNTVPKSLSDTFTKGEEVGAVIVGLGSAALSIAILSAKKESRYGFVLLALISGMLCLFGGGLFGFIIPAYFTTLRLPTVLSPTMLV